ncbi:MAG: GtrA family protein [Clostridiales bacterium]|nr:GtrA family protein [Clostridiales bacterium]
MSLFKRLWNKFVTKETVSYVIVGLLTTAVNLLSYRLLRIQFGINELLANIIAWVVAVIFAYVTNNLFVFGSGIEEKGKEITKIIKFFSARLVTLGIEEVGILIFVTWMKFPDMIVKLALAVIVIVVNYIFSKLFIFTKKQD